MYACVRMRLSSFSDVFHFVKQEENYVDIILWHTRKHAHKTLCILNNRVSLQI